MSRVTLSIPWFVGALFFNVPASFSITVEDAYKAIPHKQVTYSASESSVDSADREFLTKLFALSDRALVERIETMRAFHDGEFSRLEQYKIRIRELRSELMLLEESGSTSGMKQLLSDALVSQERFFETWQETRNPNIGADVDVERASAKLRQLYSVLMQRFSNETAHNRDSFYQHLCALDFK